LGSGGITSTPERRLACAFSRAKLHPVSKYSIFFHCATSTLFVYASWRMCPSARAFDEVFDVEYLKELAEHEGFEVPFGLVLYRSSGAFLRSPVQRMR